MSWNAALWQYYYPRSAPPAYRFPNVPNFAGNQPSFYRFPVVPFVRYPAYTLGATGAQFLPTPPVNPIQNQYGSCEVSLKGYGKASNCQVGYAPVGTADGQCQCCDAFGNCGSD